MKLEISQSFIYTPAAFLEYWQGHRRLTRKMIEAFPEKEFLSYSIGGMRPFAELVREFIRLALPGIVGVATGKWSSVSEVHNNRKAKISSKNEALEVWDEITDLIDKTWASIPSTRFEETDIAFDTYEGEIYGIIQYWVDNEIHHRGQGYVYLRSLGIDPPAFWDRS